MVIRLSKMKLFLEKNLFMPNRIFYDTVQKLFRNYFDGMN